MILMNLEHISVGVGTGSSAVEIVAMFDKSRGRYQSMTLQGAARRDGKIIITYSFLHEVAEAAIIVNINELLAAIGRIRNIQLHLGQVSASYR